MSGSPDQRSTKFDSIRRPYSRRALPVRSGRWSVLIRASRMLGTIQPRFSERGEPEQFIPLLDDQLNTDAAREQPIGREERLAVADLVEAAVREVAEARKELQAEKVE